MIAWHNAPLRDEHGKISGTLSSGQDITEQRRAEQALGKLSQVVEQSPDMILITDTEGTIEYVNPSFVKISGFAAEDAIGENPRFLKSGKTPVSVFEQMWHTIKSGKIWRGEVCNKKKNGVYYWNLVAISPIIGQLGEITHFVGIQTDITERKQAEELLRESQEKLKASEKRYRACYDEKDLYELLIRMEDKDGRLIPPGAFFPAAERYNLATKLDRWVIGTAFSWLNRHPQHLERLSLCFINLSGHSLGDQELLQFISQQFEEMNVPSQKICFEVTETAAIANLSSATYFIRELQRRGCRFALDDFGSGLSSFAYLKNLPVDFLKIDGLFVKDIVEDPIDLAMVRCINDIGHVMGKQTIAEFVENENILDKLRQIGVDYAQGYGISGLSAIEDMA